MDSNKFFENKPEWFKGYATAIAEYLVANDRINGPIIAWETVPSPLAEHFATCSIVENLDIDESLDVESIHDSFDYNASGPVCFVSTNVTCACGAYVNKRVATSGTLSDLISNITWAA